MSLTYYQPEPITQASAEKNLATKLALQEASIRKVAWEDKSAALTAAAAERSDALIGAANEKSQMLMDCSKEKA